MIKVKNCDNTRLHNSIYSYKFFEHIYSKFLNNINQEISEFNSQNIEVVKAKTLKYKNKLTQVVKFKHKHDTVVFDDIKDLFISAIKSYKVNYEEFINKRSKEVINLISSSSIERG